jgi:ethanolamine utilization protein EutN
MKLGKVIGKVVSTRKEGNIRGAKILVVSYLNENLIDTNKTVACVDTVSAGSGDIVLLCGSSSARMTTTTKNVATDNTIIGIVDSLSSNNGYIYQKNDIDSD